MTAEPERHDPVASDDEALDAHSTVAAERNRQRLLRLAAAALKPNRGELEATRQRKLREKASKPPSARLPAHVRRALRASLTASGMADDPQVREDDK